MWKCIDCEARFDEPEAYMEKHGWDTPPYEQWPCCPVCGSLDLEELFPCWLCGEEKAYHDMSEPDGSVCEDCYIQLLDKWQKIKEEAAAAFLSPREVSLLKENEVF